MCMLRAQLISKLDQPGWLGKVRVPCLMQETSISPACFFFKEYFCFKAVAQLEVFISLTPPFQ